MLIARKILIPITIVINILMAIATTFAAYAGHIDPQSMTLAPIACMGFPYLLVATLISLPISFFINKWIATIPLTTIILCISPAINYCPLNMFTANDHKKNDNNAFTLLSYNAYNFMAHDQVYPKDSTNATLSYIISTDADIVCLQECEYLSPLARWHVYKPQVDSLKEQYPHRIIGADNGESILSKFPVEKRHSEGYYSHFVVKTNKGDIDIINVHLRSLRLTNEEKRQYGNLSELNGKVDSQSSSTMKSIIKKVADAAKNRARQAEKLREYINNIDNDNIIVCGDFNDVPNCYAINTIGENFDDAYAECGFGPMITYHGDKLYFRIDHILYDGDIEATSITRDDIDRSDHYPLLVTFHWDND